MPVYSQMGAFPYLEYFLNSIFTSAPGYLRISFPALLRQQIGHATLGYRPWQKDDAGEKIDKFLAFS